MTFWYRYRFSRLYSFSDIDRMENIQFTQLINLDVILSKYISELNICNMLFNDYKFQGTEII